MTLIEISPNQVLLEGLHALKHAVRFGADIQRILASTEADLAALVERVAPDLASTLDAKVERVSRAEFQSATKRPHPTGIVAIAARPAPIPWTELSRLGPVIVIEDPRHHGNVGAAIRIAAAGGATGVATIGDLDPWSPGAIRGSAGLHFAVPVLSLGALPATDRPVFAFDPDGEDLARVAIDDTAVLVFGSERNGLSAPLKQRADRLVGFPMRAGVSSINLAASVAVGLYHWRLAGRFETTQGTGTANTTTLSS